VSQSQVIHQNVQKLIGNTNKETARCLSAVSFNSTQKAQLSQRDCAMLHIIEYFAKSLKVIQNDTAD